MPATVVMGLGNRQLTRVHINYYSCKLVVIIQGKSPLGNSIDTCQDILRGTSIISVN